MESCIDRDRSRYPKYTESVLRWILSIFVLERRVHVQPKSEGSLGCNSVVSLYRFPYPSLLMNGYAPILNRLLLMLTFQVDLKTVRIRKNKVFRVVGAFGTRLQIGFGRVAGGSLCSNGSAPLLQLTL